MKQNQIDRAFLGLSMAGFALMSVSFLFMPIEKMRILPGLLFWSGLVIGVSFQIVMEVRRRLFFASYHVKREKMQKPRNGLLTFASNKVAALVDNVFIASIVVSVLTFIFTKGIGYFCYVCVSLFVLTFCLHCVFNGRNYFHINNKNRIQQMLESKKESILKKGEGKK